MNTNTQISTFNFNTSAIRVVTIDGNPWFVATDLATALDWGYDNIKYHMKTTLDLEEKRVLSKGKGSVTTRCLFTGPSGRLTIISESGLYKLVMRSDKPEAKPFQDWVTKVVLPAIRKDGGYIMGEEKVVTGEMTEDELIFKAMGILQKKVERLAMENKELTKQLNTMDVGVYGREVLKKYLNHGDAIRLGRRAAHISAVDNLEITYQKRELTTGRVVTARLYTRTALDKAAKLLALI